MISQTVILNHFVKSQIIDFFRQGLSNPVHVLYPFMQPSVSTAVSFANAAIILSFLVKTTETFINRMLFANIYWLIKLIYRNMNISSMYDLFLFDFVDLFECK